MIPGLDSVAMFMAQGGGGAGAITGRVRYSNKFFFSEELTTDYILVISDESDVEFYENSTGMLVLPRIYVLPNAYSEFGLPYPYALIVTFFDPVAEEIVEHEYAAASIGSVNLGAPTAMTLVWDEGTTYAHQLTKTQAESFQLSTWYNFSIGGEAVIDPNEYVTFGDASEFYGPGAIAYWLEGAEEGLPALGGVSNDQFFGSTLAGLELMQGNSIGKAVFSGNLSNLAGITSIKIGGQTFSVTQTDTDGGFLVISFNLTGSPTFNISEPYTLEFIK